jgi:hypothetical protein
MALCLHQTNNNKLGLNSARVRHIYKWPRYYNNKFEVRFKITALAAIFTNGRPIRIVNV